MYRVALLVILGLFSTTAIAVERVKQFDIDKDLHVNYTELKSKCKVTLEQFYLADKNNDNVLSETELRTAKYYLFSKCNKEKMTDNK